jgi:hypothetical protein
MKSTNNIQTTEAMKKSALAPTWQAYIVEELSDDAQAAMVGGAGKALGKTKWLTQSEIDAYYAAIAAGIA